LRYFIELSFNGTLYHGWQIQPNAISIQEIVEKSLSTILRNTTTIIGAGRTDKGVHASQIFAHFDNDNDLDVKHITDKLNALLPNTIVAKQLFKVKLTAHARFDAISRKYEYRIWLGRNPFLLETTWQLHHQQLNIDAMNKASKLLFNYTNFKCFSKSKTDVKTYNCEIYLAEWVKNGNLLVFHIEANRFLRNMVRAIVGTLIEIGLDKKEVSNFKNIIESKDRSKAGFSVPAQGLFLTEVNYNIKNLKND